MSSIIVTKQVVCYSVADAFAELISGEASCVTVSDIEFRCTRTNWHGCEEYQFRFKGYNGITCSVLVSHKKFDAEKFVESVEKACNTLCFLS